MLKITKDATDVDASFCFAYSAVYLFTDLILE